MLQGRGARPSDTVVAVQNDQLRFYLQEVTYQWRVADFAAQQLEAESADLHRPEPVVRVLAPAHSILTAAAQISKLVHADLQDGWSDERRAFALDRAARLRQIVKPDEVLLRRAIRNSIEHFDARLDDTLFADVPAAILDMNVGPVSMFNVATDAVWLRHLDSDTLEYSLLGKSAPLRTVYDALRDVGARAQRWLDAHPLGTPQV